MSPVRIAKYPNTRHPKRITRDALSAQAIQDAAKTGALPPRLSAVVIGDEKRWKIRKLLVKKTPMWKAKGTSYSVSHWTTPHPRWFERVHLPHKAHRTSAPWRDITDTFKAHWAHFALSLNGDFRAFTLNIGADVETKALAMGPRAKRWFVDDRLTPGLKEALGRPALYWFRLEMGNGESPYLHLHGEIACADAEVDDVRDALRKAAGAWRGRKQDQVHTCNKSPDLGWVSYLLKYDYTGISATVSRVRGLSHTPSWRDDRFFICQELSRQTKSLYDGVRDSLSINSRPLALVA